MKELLKSCPHHRNKSSRQDTSPVFEDSLPDSEDDKPRSKVQKEAVNEAIKRAQFLHVPHAEADNPALMKKHEEIEKTECHPSGKPCSNETHKAQPNGNQLEGTSRSRPNHQSCVEMEENE